ncbi:MAG: OmpH family outer membrane protein [Sphingomonadales bacterium]
MKKARLNFVIATLIVGAMLFSAAGTVRAQNKLPEAVVIVIDGARIQQQSMVGKDVMRQIEALQKKIQTKIEAERDKLQTEGETLQAQFASLTPEQLVPRRRQFDAKVQAFRRMVEEKQQAIQRVLTLANNEIERAMRPILREIMNRKSANFVFDKAQIALSVDSIEVTDEVVEMLDKKLPTFMLDTAGLE